MEQWRVRIIEAQFTFNLQGNQTAHAHDQPIRGGGIMDVGCYCLSGVRAVAGAAREDFEEPTELQGSGHIGATGVDEWACATFEVSRRHRRNICCGMQVGHTVNWPFTGRRVAW